MGRAFEVLERADAMTRVFWEACSRRVLVRPVCDSCQKSFFPPQVACPICLGVVWQYHESCGTGTIYSFSEVHRAPSDEFSPPYVVVDVDLDGEGWNMMCNLDMSHGGRVNIGMRVNIGWEIRRGNSVWPIFRPAQGEIL